MFKQRSQEKELLDDLHLNSIDLIQNLHEQQFTNRWFGSRQTIISALDQIYKTEQNLKTSPPVIADLGCGSGDLLRVTETWSQSKKISPKLIGIDANPYIIEHARDLSSRCNIDYFTIDIFSKDFDKLKFDITMLNSFCHHFNNEQLSDLLSRLCDQTRYAVIINDLHRHWLPYYGIKVIANLMHFSSLGKHDAPTSVLRAFNKSDLTNLLDSLNIKHYQLRWTWAFRWQLIIWCNKKINN